MVIWNLKDAYVSDRRRKVKSSRGNSMCKDIDERRHSVLNLEICKYKVRGINIVGNNVGQTDRI